MNSRSLFALTLVLALSVALSACGSPTTPAPSATEPSTSTGTAVDVAWQHVIEPDVPVVARVNGVDISTQAYLQEVRRQLALLTVQYEVDWSQESVYSSIPELQAQILQQLVLEELSVQLAAADGIVVQETAVQEGLAQAKEEILNAGKFASWDQYLSTIGSTQEALEARMRAQLLMGELREARVEPVPDELEQVFAAHILVATEEEANEVLSKLISGADFAVLASEHSVDEANKDTDGEIGWFARGMMAKEFEDAAFALEPGKTSGVVQTEYGYHIILVLGREVRPVGEQMRRTLASRNYATWLAGEMAQASIELLIEFE